MTVKKALGMIIWLWFLCDVLKIFQLISYPNIKFLSHLNYFVLLEFMIFMLCFFCFNSWHWKRMKLIDTLWGRSYGINWNAEFKNNIICCILQAWIRCLKFASLVLGSLNMVYCKFSGGWLVIEGQTHNNVM